MGYKPFLTSDGIEKLQEHSNRAHLPRVTGKIDMRGDVGADLRSLNLRLNPAEAYDVGRY